MNNHNCLSLHFKGNSYHHLTLSFISISVTGQQYVSQRILIILRLSAAQYTIGFLNLHEYWAVEQSPLHWHLTISIMALGTGSTLVVTGLCLCRNRASDDLKTAAEKRFPVMMWCLSAPGVGGSLPRLAIYWQNRCLRSSGMLAIWMLFGAYAAETNVANIVSRSSVISVSSEIICKALTTSPSALSR